MKNLFKWLVAVMALAVLCFIVVKQARADVVKRTWAITSTDATKVITNSYNDRLIINRIRVGCAAGSGINTGTLAIVDSDGTTLQTIACISGSATAVNTNIQNLSIPTVSPILTLTSGTSNTVWSVDVSGQN